MNRKEKILRVMTVTALGSWSIAWAQVAPPSILTIDVQNRVQYFEDTGDLHLQFRRRNVHLRVLRHLRIADAREHVCDRIGCGHDCCPP